MRLFGWLEGNLRAHISPTVHRRATSVRTAHGALQLTTAYQYILYSCLEKRAFYFSGYLLFGVVSPTLLIRGSFSDTSTAKLIPTRQAPFACLTPFRAGDIIWRMGERNIRVAVVFHVHPLQVAHVIENGVSLKTKQTAAQVHA